MSMLYRTLLCVTQALAVALVTALSGSFPARADSVAQVQTTKFFAPETVQLLVDRAVAGNPGLRVGDTVNYIIQFSPVPNGGNIGVAGYVTDYIPPGAEVIGASIVNKDGAGNFYTISPSLPGGIATGWGQRGQNTFTGIFGDNGYDATGRCAASGTPTTTTITTSGDWTVPAGVTSVTVEAWGGGGAGGGLTTNTGAGQSFKGGGGAGGQYAASVLSVIPGNYAVVVGTGGTGSTGNGTAGNDSTFGVGAVIAKGGAGGLSYENGGAAGTGSSVGGVGTTIYAGGSGSAGGATTIGGAGGGGAGSTGAGGNAAGNTAGTGTATGGGNGGAGLTNRGNGNAGNAAGGAGGGAFLTQNRTNDFTGGAGARGQISITYMAGFTDNCNARLTELYADTGIFFSTDPRTAVLPVLPTRILQGGPTTVPAGNGYNINPTGANNLNGILGQNDATTHNLWDADQTNAFGSADNLDGTVDYVLNNLVSPKSNATVLISAATGSGTGATPYNAGSAVAGPQSGYQLDNTGQVGPWQRIAYAGSRIGDNTNGPATAEGPSVTAVGGASTSVGWNLSAANPLPAGTSAVRWAIGQLVVGEIRYVKISLRLTVSPPTDGIINSSEVFGGDVGGDYDNRKGKDNTWRYHVPSVADNNSNLYLLKSVVCVFSGGVCQPSQGAYIPALAKVRYRIVYMNSGNVTQNNVTLSDTLPCQTAANPVSNITIVSGPIGLPSPNPPVVAAGACPTRRTFSFPTVASLGPGAGGSIELDVQTSAALNSTVTNSAKLVTTQIPAGVTSHANSYVQDAPNLVITKTTSTPSRMPGETATYTITIQNAGTAATNTSLIVYDILPSDGATVNATKRFSYVPLSSTCTGSITCVNPNLAAVPPLTGTAVPPTLTPYNTGGVSANQQQILWNFGVQTLAAGASFTISFNATVGANVAASATPYYNTAVVTYGGGVGRADTYNVAGVTVISPLSVTKSIECYFVGVSCVPYSNNIPINAKVRYKIVYANTSGSAITNVILTDTLPCQTAANSVSNVNIVSGPILVPSPNPPVIAAGSCPATRQTFSFPTLASLAAGQTGQIKFDVQTNAASGNIVVNTATLSGTGVVTVSSEVQASVLSASILLITKTASVPAVAQGGTLSYTITVTNTGTTPASNIVLYDWLPTSGSVNNVSTRFTFVAGSSVFGGSIASVTPAVSRPPTQQTFNNVPSGSNPNLNNQEEIAWSFGAPPQTLAPSASFSVTFQSQVGASVPNSPPSYSNFARVKFAGGQADSGAATVKVGTLLDHYKISYPNGSPGVTCEALAVRITGHDSSHGEVAPAGGTQITLSTSPATGGWALKTGGNPFTPPNKYTFNGTETFAEFWLTQTTPLANININVTDGAKTEHSTEDPLATFDDTAFRYSHCPGAVPGSCSVVSINNQIAGKSSNIAPNAQSLYLRAVVKDTITGACVGGLEGSQTVQFAYECDNPATCSASDLMSIYGSGPSTPIARNNDAAVSATTGSYALVSMFFDAYGYAPFTLNYSDAGLVTLHARKTVTAGVGTPPSAAATIYGASNAFVVRPFAFSISGPGIPALTGLPTDILFGIAGQNFPATVTAVVWEAADDTDNDGAPDSGADLSGNAATPNFGQENNPGPAAGATMTHLLVRPQLADGGTLGELTGATAYTGFTAGASTQNLIWNEVGSITLKADLTGGNYLASGQSVTGSVSPVGRFRPHHFIVTPGTLTNRVLSNCSVFPKTVSTFTYVGEQMAVNNFQVTARNALATPGQTYNYASTFGDPDNNFARLNGAVFANFGFGAVDLEDLILPTAATALTLDLALSSSSGTWTSGVGTFTATTAVTRTSPGGPYESFRLGILPADTDGVTLRTADLNLDTTVPADSNDRALAASGIVRFGRLRLQNAYGSELLPLPIPMTVQYWNGTAFITNDLDRCTTLTAANIGFANYIPNLGPGETTPTVGSVFVAGVGSLILSAPGPGNNGSVDLCVDLGADPGGGGTVCLATVASMPYLQGLWAPGTAWNNDPTARATFGVYSNPSQFIYLREMY